MILLNVFLGGGLGALLRYALSLAANKKYGFTYQITFLINVLGSFFLGIVVYLSMSSLLNLIQYKFWAIGLAGGFTTFSTFGYENYLLLQEKKFANSFVYSLLSVVVSILSFYLGYKILSLNF